MKTQPNFFKSLCNTVGGGIVVADIGGVIRFANPGICKMLGYSEEELLGIHVNEITAPDDIASTVQAIEESVINVGYEVQLEKVYLKKDGDRFYGLTTIKSYEHKGELFLSAFINDFAAQYLARQRIEKQYKDIIELADDVIFTVDPSGNFVYANQVAQDTTGLNEKEILTKNYLELVAPSYQEQVREIYRKHFLERKDSIQFTFPINNADGGTCWLDQKLNTIWDTDRKRIIGYSAVARNVTMERETALKLQESERNYQALFNDSPVPLWLEDLSDVMERVSELKNEGVQDFRKYFDDNLEELINLSQKIKVLQVNQKVLSLYGASSEEELFVNFPKLFTEEAVNAFKNELIHLVEKTSSSGIDYKTNKIDGDELVVRMQWSLMPGHEDKFDKVFVSTLDITEQYNSQLEIRESERILSTVFKNLGIPILISDPKDARLVEVNEVAVAALGYSKESLLKMNIGDLDASHDKAYVIKALKRCYKEGLVQGISKWKIKSGEVRDISIKNSLINIAGEDRILSACVDITELKKLNVENERFRIAMDNAPFAIYISNADSNELLDVNTTACDQLGYTRKELLKMTLQDIEQKDFIKDPKLRKEHSRTLKEGKEPMVIEGVHKRKDGTMFPVKVTVDINTIGEENYMIGSVFDDTWAKETHKKLKEVNKALSEEIQFRKVIQKHSLDVEEREQKRIARDLHDGLGQRLTAVKLSLGAIKNGKEVTGPSAEILNETIKLVEGSMGEVRMISQNIMPAVLTDFGLGEGLKKACEQMSDSSSILVNFKSEGKGYELEDFVKITLYRIGQECINNALKYSKSDVIDVGVDYCSNQKYVQVRVRDYGIGFDPKKVKVGMGLNNIKERTEMIQGELTIKSKLNIGTTIQVKYLF